MRARWLASARDRARLRKQVFDVIEASRGDDGASRLVDTVLILLIVLNIAAFVLETVPSIQVAWGPWLNAFEVFSVAVFTLEYGLRLWSCVEAPFLRKFSPWRARLHFATRPYLIIDLLAILPFYLSFLVTLDLRLLRVLRLMRFLKLARYSPAMHTLVRVLSNERRALIGALLLVMTALLFAATGMYYIESAAQPETFGSIPQSAWWAMVTLTTVGYGDVTPITPLGRVFAGFVMLMGLIVLALPIAIIATGFSQEVSRRDFVLTWSMLSKIPLFSELDASAVAALMRYLHAHNYPPNWEIVPPGAEANSMYFVASGRVRANGADREIEHGAGDFFGEVAMIDGTRHPHGYTTVARTRLLQIFREDFQRMLTAHPDIAEHIRRVADERRGRPGPTIEPEDDKL
jgi:voltage-gated potassium channel